MVILRSIILIVLSISPATGEWSQSLNIFNLLYSIPSFTDRGLANTYSNNRYFISGFGTGNIYQSYIVSLTYTFLLIALTH